MAKRVFLFILLVLWLVACAWAGLNAPAQTLPKGETTGIPSQARQVTITASAETSVALPTAAPPAQTSDGKIFKLLSPQDGEVVDTPSIRLRGFAPPETVITVNEEVFLVGPEGKFEIPLMLEEGPNVIEIVASDLLGNEESVVLVVTYQP
ncbi:MAG: hypothetical protein ACK4VW_07485 [Anaerolineales bacterium]